jgi:hypothetical protein
MAGDEPQARYRFGPLERRGLVAGWRGGQLLVVAVGLVVAVLALRGQPSMGGVAGAVAAVCVAVAGATWPLHGRTAEQWAPDALRQLRTSLARRAGRAVSPFGSLEVLRVDAAGAQVAVVLDARARTYTGVVRAWGPGFVLAGPDDKAARVGSWASVLSALGRQGSAIHRLQWLARCRPDDGAALRRHWQAAGVLGPDAEAQRSYGALLESEAGATCAHEVLLALSVDARRSARAVRAAGGGERGACTLVLREVAWLRRQLADAGIDSGSLLDPGELAEAVRRGFEPDAAPMASPGAMAAAWPWPMALEAEWGRARADGTWHVTYWMAEWPRREVGPDFLGPLLLCGVRGAVSVVMEPVDPAQAARRVEQARTADIADAELRRRGGFLHSARRRREEEVLAAREHELADGHAQYRFTGYVTVSAGSPEALEDACARVEQAAGRSAVDLRRCYGDQAAAFACTLPLGRGLC